MKEGDSQNLSPDITGKPKRLIPVDPIISPFDSGEDKVSREETYIPYRPPEHPFSPDQDSDPDSPAEGSENPGSPLIPRLPIAHQESAQRIQLTVKQIPS